MSRSLAGLSAHRLFIFWFGALYGIFLWPLFNSERGFILGDYGAQFYPWLYVYSESLRQGQLPLWTPLIHSGFPLFAEGQTGMLYLPNLLLFKFLPFKAAYNAIFLTHFMAAGVFTYLFARKRGLSTEASTIAALAFAFGSAYGGCFYNIVAMRTLVWFPLALYLVEKHLDKKKILPLFILAFIQSQSWLAGFPQLAAYSTFFIGAYFFLRSLEIKAAQGQRMISFALFAGSMALSLLIALPQIWATLEWARQSTRSLYGRDFAMWGSVPPWCITTLFIYSWGSFLRYKVYIGLWPALVALVGGRDARTRVMWILAAVSIFFALGSFNPVNWSLTYLPIAGLLRNPSKFLFFTAFFLSVIAGFGYDRIHLIGVRGVKILSALVVAGAVGALLFVRGASEVLLRFGEWYVRSFVIGKSHHQKTAEEYLLRIKEVLADIHKEIDPANPIFWVPVVLVLLFGFLFFFGRIKEARPILKMAFIPVLLADLFIFGQLGYGTGFVGNLGAFPETSALKGLPSDGRWLDVSREENALFPPNRNLLTGHAQIGAYSPLIDREYYLLTKGFGALDDSFGRTVFLSEELGSHRDLLDFLGVKYIATPIDQPIDGFRQIAALGSHRIYVNDQALDEFMFASPAGHADVRVLEQSPMYARVEAQSERGGVLVRNQLYSKGWSLRIDGKHAKLEKVGRAFQAVEIPKGGHRVEWLYEPSWFTIGRWFYFIGSVFVALAILALGMLKIKGRWM